MRVRTASALTPSQLKKVCFVLPEQVFASISAWEAKTAPEEGTADASAPRNFYSSMASIPQRATYPSHLFRRLNPVRCSSPPWRARRSWSSVTAANKG